MPRKYETIHGRCIVECKLEISGYPFTIEDAFPGISESSIAGLVGQQLREDAEQVSTALFVKDLIDAAASAEIESVDVMRGQLRVTARIVKEDEE